MAMTAADILVETLADWGVEVVFGMPGDGINGIMEALRTRKDKVRFVQVRHEESAAFMACGYAKYTGKLGVCLATSGPGGVHLLNGLYDAKMDGQPVLAITGHHYHDLIDTHQQQDVNLDRVFVDACVYSTRVMGPTHVQNVTDLACRTALSRRGDARARGQVAGVIPFAAPDSPDVFASEADTEERVALRDQARRVRDAIAKLPADARAVVVLRDLQGLSTKEAAAVLGISEGAVKVRLHRAHAKLRKLVDR